MELKSTIIAILLLLLLATPSPARGGSEVLDHVVDSPIYEIDYRGPETHTSYVPPPKRSGGGRRPNTPHQSIAADHTKSNGLGAIAASKPAQVHRKKIHG